MKLSISKVTASWLIVILACYSCTSHSRDRIVFMCAIGYSNPIQVQLLDLYKKAFDALDIDFHFDVEPLSRTISLAVSGKSDGDCIRVGNYINLSGAPNLIRVDSPVVSIKMQMWRSSFEREAPHDGKPEVTGKRIGYLRGDQWTEDYLKRQNVRLVAVTQAEQGIKMLVSKRLDFFVAPSFMVTGKIKSLELDTEALFVGTVATLQFYPYLNVRHQALEESLENELNRLIMERGGLIQ